MVEGHLPRDPEPETAVESTDVVYGVAPLLSVAS